MDKEDLINKLIVELQKDNAIFDSGELSLFKKEGFDDIEWDEISNHFNKLDNIETYHSLFNSWQNNFLTTFSELKNLKHLQFQSGEIEETEKNIEDGLGKMPKLETLWFAGTQLKEFPQIITDTGYSFKFNNSPISSPRPLPNLKTIGILGNKFYKQNFHFKLKKECKDLYQKIESLDEMTNNPKPKEYIGFKSIVKKEFHSFTIQPWGYSHHEDAVLILKDDFINENKNINSISVYILNENEQDKYKTFKLYYGLFTKLNKKLKCFGRIFLF